MMSDPSSTQEPDVTSTPDGSILEGNVGGNSADAWEVFKNALPEDLREDTHINSHKSIEGLMKTFVNQRKMTGDRLGKPKEDWKDEDWDKFYRETGRPDEATDYHDPSFGDIDPNALGIGEENIKQFKEEAHKMGLNKKQYEQYVQSRVIDEAQIQQQLAQDRRDQIQKNQEILQAEFGERTAYEVEVVNEFATKKIDNDLYQEAKSKGYFNDATFIKILSTIQKDYQDSTLIDGKSNDFMGGKTRAIADFNNLRSDPLFQAQLSSPDSAVRNAAKNKYQQLQEAKNRALGVSF